MFGTLRGNREGDDGGKEGGGEARQGKEFNKQELHISSPSLAVPHIKSHKLIQTESKAALNVEK